MAGAQAGGFEDASAASPLHEQLRLGFRWLRFEPALEAAWRAEQFQDGLRYLRVSLVLLAAFILVINQVDQGVLPAIREIAPRMAGVGVMPPLLLLGFALTFARGAAAWYPRAMTAAMAAALVAVGWVALAAWGLGEGRVFVRLIIATIIVYFAIGLPFRHAFGANLVGFAFLAVSAAASGMPAADLNHHVSMLLMANVICAVGAYNLEHASRTAWLEGKLLAELALHDGLTGIHNRRRFDEHLERVWQQGMRERKPVSLLFADIDHFKKYNDRYGHQAGDEALRAVAAVLARHARRPFDLAARFGGEEFAVLLYDAVSREASRIAGEILAEVRAQALVHEDGVAGGVLTVSIGVATAVPQAKRSAAGLLQLADQALYAAKDGGRDQARSLEEDYEHMKTGYFHRRMVQGGGADGQ
ncbi:MAG TPA: diguanylate cyclase [Steroidobacteraceae bacterium]|jgi:diguanylate cyclase (GGDEF)-like protein